MPNMRAASGTVTVNAGPGDAACSTHGEPVNDPAALDRTIAVRDIATPLTYFVGTVGHRVRWRYLEHGPLASAIVTDEVSETSTVYFRTS
jgi:hypothetical protein